MLKIGGAFVTAGNGAPMRTLPGGAVINGNHVEGSALFATA